MTDQPHSPDSGESAAPSTAMVAVLLLAKPELPDTATLQATLRDLFPDDAPAVTEQDRNADSVVLTVGDAYAAAALVDVPVPWSELEGPCHTAWYWPHAAAQVQGHQAHLIITLTRDGHIRDESVQAARDLTQLSAAMATQLSALGVFWATGTLVHDPTAFTQMAQKMAADWLPLYLWIDFRLNDEANAAYSLFTTGMNAFGMMEIEIPMLIADEPKLLIDQAYHVAHYLLENGPILNDGDSIGMSPTIRVTVHHEPSFLGATQMVYSLRP